MTGQDIYANPGANRELFFVRVVVHEEGVQLRVVHWAQRINDGLERTRICDGMDADVGSGETYVFLVYFSDDGLHHANNRVLLLR